MNTQRKSLNMASPRKIDVSWRGKLPEGRIYVTDNRSCVIDLIRIRVESGRNTEREPAGAEDVCELTVAKRQQT